MKFCFVTTFYPPYHFGGDAVFVSQLAAELARRGHVIDVVHDVDAFRVARPRARPVPIASPPHVTVHALSSPFGRLSSLVTHQTGRPWLTPALRDLLDDGAHDVIHFHNASLIGPGAFSYGRGVRLYTTHEQWLVCPLHLLWKFGARVCESPQCVPCCLRAGRPPQWWRYTSYLRDQLRAIDRVLAPNPFIVDVHRARGFDLPFTVLRNFVPASAFEVIETPSPRPRPYVLFAGRLTTTKGLQTVLPLFRSRPDIDLVVAGDGEMAETLRAHSAGAPNIVFLGQVRADVLRTWYRHAIALLVPSQVYEVGPLVALEAFAQGTPVVGRAQGGLADIVRESGGGLLFDSDHELSAAIDGLVSNPDRRREIGQLGLAAVRGPWGPDAHIAQYLEIVQECLDAKGPRKAR